jgi:hypothetical protein
MITQRGVFMCLCARAFGQLPRSVPLRAGFLQLSRVDPVDVEKHRIDPPARDGF